MGGTITWLAVFALRVLLLFADKQEYSAKVAELPSMAEKHAEAAIDGWEYRTLAAHNGNYRHDYFFYPSPKQDAPVLLLIHGLNLDGRTFLNVTKLAEHWQLVAYNLPERCPLYRGQYDDWRAVIDDFITHYPDSITAVAGVSFGGGMAIHVAANHPGVKRLFLLSTTILNATEEQRRQSRTMGNWVGSLPDYKIYYLMKTLIERNEDRLAEAAWNGRDVRDVLDMKRPDFFRQVALSMDDYDPHEDAPRVTCPTYVLIGSEDGLYASDHEQMMRRYLPRLEYEVLTGGTHSMVYLRGEQIADRIIAFCHSVSDFTFFE